MIQPNQYEDTELRALDTLFKARKVLTDSITATSASYENYEKVVRTANEQLDKLDALIEKLAERQSLNNKEVQ